mgnify:CR=1 FL=1
MTYKYAPTLSLTRNCFKLVLSDATKPISFLKSKITYVNGNYSICDLGTGLIAYNSRYRKQPTYNKVNDNPAAYVITPVYFTNPDNPTGESLYRHGKVHILNTLLSAYHRALFMAALHRAAEQDGCDLSEARVHVHHIDVDKRNNAIYNLLPVTDNEHYTIHTALIRGASTYESLVAGLGEDLVHDIFGIEYFDYGDGGGVYTASINGTSYAQHILGQISSANLPTDTKVLEVQLLNGSFDYIAIDGLNIYQILTALYIKSAIWVLKP